MIERNKVLLDTDIGSDIDDAIALAFLLGRGDCDLLGVTTVSGDVAERAACAEVICRAAGRADMPIHLGAVGALLVGPGQPGVPNYKTIASKPHCMDRPAGTAVEFLRQTIHDHPGQITLCCTGPLTNVALLFALDPETPKLLKSLVTMNGQFFGSRDKHELNALCDPFAAAMVYNAACHRHICIGMDVTRGCALTVQQVGRHFITPALRLVCDMADDWLRSPRDIFLNDTVAAVVALQPELCRYEPGKVEMPISADANRAGTTNYTPSPQGPHLVARQLDMATFQSQLLRTFIAEPVRMAG